MNNIRDNKKVMTGIAVGLCLLAAIVLGWSIFGGSAPPAAPTEAELAGQALIEQMQQQNTRPVRTQPEEPPAEPGSGRVLVRPGS
jgi:hypothetical protein